MMVLAVGLPEVLWNVGFFSHLLTGRSLVGVADYMFDPQRPLLLRGLSLFHVFLPALLVWLVYRLGYDRRALVAQTLLCWAVLTATYLLTSPADNINWVFGPGGQPQTRLSPLAYLLLEMALFFLCVYLPTHLLLRGLLTTPPAG
jgi:hypothetical protein